MYKGGEAVIKYRESTMDPIQQNNQNCKGNMCPKSHAAGPTPQAAGPKSEAVGPQSRTAGLPANKNHPANNTSYNENPATTNNGRKPTPKQRPFSSFVTTQQNIVGQSMALE